MFSLNMFIFLICLFLSMFFLNMFMMFIFGVCFLIVNTPYFLSMLKISDEDSVRIESFAII